MTENQPSESYTSSAMSDLGIDPSTLDDGSIEAPQEEGLEANELEAEGQEASKEIVESKEGDEESEGEGEQAATEQASEEPRLTAKEFQEIEAQRRSLEAEKKSFMEEQRRVQEEFQRNYAEKVKTHDELDAFLTHLASERPEFFDEIKSDFQAYQRTFNNPVIESLRQKQAAMEAELNQFKSKASDEVTRTKLDSEITEVKNTLGKQAEAMGLKPDWSKVEDFWADNPKTDVKAAFYAIYGEALAKASVSKTKVESVEKKVAARPAAKTAGSMSRSAAPVEKDYSKMSIADMLRYEARRVTGRA